MARELKEETPQRPAGAPQMQAEIPQRPAGEMPAAEPAAPAPGQKPRFRDWAAI